ncbi:MAG: hypothetical protein LH654_00790 [Thermoleophilia bacterium]|nr:hypothetical protein [Thermoleophilia bacterium]
MRRLKSVSLRRLVPWVIATTVLVVGAGALVSTSQSSVTRPRLERDLSQTFANRYVAQAKLLGHSGVTVEGMRPRTQCYKGVPNVNDQGSGAGVWLCYMKWYDSNVDETLMPGKFELNVHSNSCYTATGPSKLVGLLTITDKNDKDVINPVSEFDGCFDPHGLDTPTGNLDLVPTKTSPTGLASIAIAAATLHPDGNSIVRPTITCSPGQEGCGGTIVATVGGTPIDTVTYVLSPDSKGRLVITIPKDTSGGEIVLSVTPVIGKAATPKVTLAIK